MSVLATLALLAAASSETPASPTVSVAQLRGMSPEQLADAILPAGHPPIIRTRIGYGGRLEVEIAHFLFYPKSARLGGHFCRQVTIDAPVTPITVMGAAIPETFPMPRRTGPPTTRTAYRYRATDGVCDGRDQFFKVEGMSVHKALNAVRLLHDTAIAMKESGARQPPFPAYCDFYLHRADTGCDRLAAVILGDLADIQRVTRTVTRGGHDTARLEMMWWPRGTEVTMVTYRGRIEYLSLVETEISE